MISLFLSRHRIAFWTVSFVITLSQSVTLWLVAMGNLDVVEMLAVNAAIAYPTIGMSLFAAIYLEGLWALHGGR